MNIFERQLQLKLKCAGHEIARCGMRIHRLREKNQALAYMVDETDILNKNLLLEVRDLLAIQIGQDTQIKRLQKTIGDVELSGDPTTIRRLQSDLKDALERVRELERELIAWGKVESGNP